MNQEAAGQGSKLTRLLGFDSGGETFLSQDRVFRGIYKGHGVLYRDVLHICEAQNLFQMGIVATHEPPINPYPELPYDIILEHERIPFISYPHEWTASMLKEAALFHTNLYSGLALYELTLKDWHPHNILFNDTLSIFIDFTSIIPVTRLFDEAYLTPPRVPGLFRYVWDRTSAYIYEIYRRMCVPYFLLPLYLMHAGQHAYARQRLLETVMNASNSVITETEVFSINPSIRTQYRRRNFIKRAALMQRGTAKNWFWNCLSSEISSLSVKPHVSGYSGYYSEKDEAFQFDPSANWTNKQHTVYNVIREFKPQTLLDIGSNTGWFSILGAKLGSKVVALDVDEACADALYRYAKNESLPILPLVGDITQPTPDIAPLAFEHEPSLSLISGDAPLILSSTQRLKCDMVLALAIVHHLALGRGLHFDQICKILSSYTERYLLVEFVAKEDRLIVEDTAFFQSYSTNPLRYEWYTLDTFVNQLRSHFQSVEALPSHPDSRTILLCTKHILATAA